MTEKKLLIKKENNCVSLILNRPEIHNAFDDELIQNLIDALIEIEADKSIRVVTLEATGKNFSSGADLNWMQRMTDYSEDENLSDSKILADLMRRLNRLSKPTIAIVQGAAFGGAVGLIACCDIAIASETSSFSFSEVKIGLIPAVIGPYIIAAIGECAARRYFLTAERFSAKEALKLGFIHVVTEEMALEKEKRYFTNLIVSNGPKAVEEAKKLIRRIAPIALSPALQEETAAWIAKIRVSPEGQEGLKAFLEKRKPNWILD